MALDDSESIQSAQRRNIGLLIGVRGCILWARKRRLQKPDVSNTKSTAVLRELLIVNSENRVLP